MAWIDFMADFVPHLLAEEGFWGTIYQTLVGLSLLVYTLWPLIAVMLFIGLIQSIIRVKEMQKGCHNCAHKNRGGGA